jgi:hypothetical protein
MAHFLTRYKDYLFCINKSNCKQVVFCDIDLLAEFINHITQALKTS